MEMKCAMQRGCPFLGRLILAGDEQWRQTGRFWRGGAVEVEVEVGAEVELELGLVGSVVIALRWGGSCMLGE